MSRYFDKEQSIAARMGDDAAQILETIATRFRADNPPLPVQYAIRSADGFGITYDYMDEIKLHEKFENLEHESYVYAWADLCPPQPGPFHFRFGAYGPVTIWLNGEKVYRTVFSQERFSDNLADVCLNLKEGHNSLLFECIATPLGCGFRIGSISYKGRRIQFFSPDEAYRGMSGFVYSYPRKMPLKEGETPQSLEWLPRMDWSKREAALGTNERLFGGAPMLSVTRLDCPRGGDYHITGKFLQKEGTKPLAWSFQDGTLSAIPVHSDGTLDETICWNGKPRLLVLFGHDVKAQMTDPNGENVPFENPVLLLGNAQGFVYAGPFCNHVPTEEELCRILTFRKPIAVDGGESFWRVDLPGMYLRPVNEGMLYGEWNYPLGVTLYGLAQTARRLGDTALDRYVAGHMKKCVSFFDYCMWDQSRYGAAPFHNQLTTMESLDDCGSIASALLEVMKDHEIPEGEKVADYVAIYIAERQQRLADGTFYRNHSYMPIGDETMWADDLYMSIPFMCRYYQKSGQESWLDDAAGQLQRFFGYLYMPEVGVLSHIYDTHYQVQTKVPWGRGNGWALFSAAELLSVMPKSHRDYEAVLSIYHTLCAGYLKLQDADGMWHQVLTMEESYQETSCTAMFAYGFAKGVQNGWLSDPAPYARAARMAWKGLCRISIDWKGNIFGVCRGSGYSFSKDYYANSLSWNINDTHGTGIVLLAGIEVEHMKDCLE